MKKRLNVRIGSLLLAFVMAFSLLPMNAMAEDSAFIGTGTGSEVNPPFKGDSTVAKGYGAIWGQFTRFTLVKFDLGHNDSAISDLSQLNDSNVHIIGSIDVSSDRGSSSGNGYGDGISKEEAAQVYQWWDTNALSYLTESRITEGGASAATPTGYGVSHYHQQSLRQYSAADPRSMWANRFREYHDLLAELDLTAGQGGIPKDLPIWGTDTTGDNYLATIFSDTSGTESEVGASGKNNKFFNELLRRLSGGAVDAGVFGTHSNSCTYRLLVEPGWVTALDNYISAATLRDMGAWIVDREWTNHKATGNSCSKQGTPLWYAHYQGSRKLAYGLTTQNEFFAYTWDGTTLSRLDNGTTVFTQPAEKLSAFTGDIKTLNLGRFAGTMFGLGGDGKTSTSSYPEGTCVGYGLGVISPYDFEMSAATIQKILVGDVPVEDIDHMWELTMEYTEGRAESVIFMDGTTDITNDPNRVQAAADGNGYKIWVKAGDPVSVQITEPVIDGKKQTVFYSVSETDPKAANYASTLMYNGEDYTYTTDEAHERRTCLYNNSAQANSSITFINSAGVTISKEATGFAADEEFGFDILCTKTDPGTGYPLPLSFAEAGEASMIKSNGSETTVDLSGTATGFNRAPFSLKNGESVRFLIPGEWNYQITETNANVGCVTTANDVDIHFSQKIPIL